MTTRITRFALLSTASAAAAAFAMPGTAAAQTTTPPSTTCTVSTTDATVFNCLNGTTAVSTLTVTSGSFAGTTPLSISSTVGNIAVTGTSLNNGVIQNTTDFETALTLNNSFAGGGITFNAAGQAITSAGRAVQFTANGGPVVITAGNLTAANSIAIEGSGGTTTNVTVGNISAPNALGTAGVGAELRGTGDITFTAGTINSGLGGFLLESAEGNVTGTTGAINSRSGVQGRGTGVNITTAGITATNGFGIFAQGTTGAVRLRTGAVSATNGFGVTATSTTGAIDIGNCPTVSTTGDNNAAISATTTSGTVTINCGAVSTTGSTSAGVLVNAGAGAVSVTVTGVTTTGANSDAISVNSSGPVTVTNTGTINVSGDNSVGIDVATTGTGAVNVTTGVVTSTAANAAADANFAAVRVVATDAAPVTLNVNGNVSSTAGTAVLARSGGTVAVTVAQGVTVSGPTAITLAGTTGNTLVVNGTLTSTTAGTPGFVLVNAGAPLSLTIGAQGSVAGPLTFTIGNDAFTNSRTAGTTQSGALDFGAGNDTFTNTTTFTQNAAVTFGEGNDTLTNSGVLNIAGTMDFGAGTDLLNNTATGTVNVTAASTLLGLETLTNAGTFNQNFNLTMDDTANVVNNSGTFNAIGTVDFAGGTDAFNNSGTFNVLRGATTLLSVDTFTNTGLIDMRDGAANDTLTIGGAFVGGTNSRLGIDVVGVNGLNTTDRLTVGGAISGTTTVLSRFTNPVIDTTGSIIASAGAGAGTVAANAFVLGGTTSAGLINYSLETRGNNVFLVSRPDEVVFDQLFVGRMGSEIWYQSFDAYQAYALSRRIDYGNERKGPVGIWAQLYGSRDRSGDRNRQVTAFNTALTTSSRFETNRRGAQTGLDFGVQNFVIGVTGGYERAEGDSDFGSELVAEGYNYGAYAQFGAQQGLYAGVLVKRDDFDVRVQNNGIGLGIVNPDGRSTGADGEVGFRFGNPGGINIDVGAGVSYVRTNLDDYTFGNVAFESDRFTSTRGRLQARATFAGTLAPFIDGKVFREFGDEFETTVRSGTLSQAIQDEGRGTWARLEAGLGGGAGGGPLLSGFIDLGDVRGFGVRGGFRF